MLLNAQVSLDVASGLAALHASGVIHRDLKPQVRMVQSCCKLYCGQVSGLGSLGKTGLTEQPPSLDTHYLCAAHNLISCTACLTNCKSCNYGNDISLGKYWFLTFLVHAECAAREGTGQAL